MPTYKNNGPGAVVVIGTNGVNRTAAPGDEIETYHRYSIPDFDLISEEPYYNPVTGIQVKTRVAAGAENVAIPAGTTWLKCWRVSGTDVTVYYHSTDNTPAVAVLEPGDAFIAKTDNRVGVVVLGFAGAGQCEVVTASEEIAE